jgi:uncharacterized membrane protein
VKENISNVLLHQSNLIKMNTKKVREFWICCWFSILVELLTLLEMDCS